MCFSKRNKKERELSMYRYRVVEGGREKVKELEREREGERISESENRPFLVSSRLG